MARNEINGAPVPVAPGQHEVPQQAGGVLPRARLSRESASKCIFLCSGPLSFSLPASKPTWGHLAKLLSDPHRLMESCPSCEDWPLSPGLWMRPQREAFLNPIAGVQQVRPTVKIAKQSDLSCFLKSISIPALPGRRARAAQPQTLLFHRCHLPGP